MLNIDGAGKLRGRFYLTGGVFPAPVTSPSAVTDGAWHHVVLTAASTTQSLYLDGVKLGSIDGAVADRSRTYAYLGRVFAFDEFGPLGIRPTAGSCWAEQGRPGRHPATYHRTYGVRYLHGCY